MKRERGESAREEGATGEVGEEAVSLVLDFDGTITEDDVLDAIARRFGDPEVHREVDAALDRGGLTLRDAISREYEPVRTPLDEVLAWVHETARIRPGFVDLVRRAREEGWRVIVLSSGFQEFIRPMLDRLDVEVELLANRVEPLLSGWRVHWRDEAICPVCGEACKRSGLPGEGEIVYVGDGYSDRCSALAAGRIFAVPGRGLAAYLDAVGVPYEEFTDFHEIAAALASRWPPS